MLLDQEVHAAEVHLPYSFFFLVFVLFCFVSFRFAFFLFFNFNLNIALSVLSVLNMFLSIQFERTFIAIKPDGVQRGLVS